MRLQSQDDNISETKTANEDILGFEVIAIHLLKTFSTPPQMRFQEVYVEGKAKLMLFLQNLLSAVLLSR